MTLKIKMLSTTLLYTISNSSIKDTSATVIFWDFFFYRLCCPTNFCLLSINLLKSIKIKTKHHFNWFIIYLDRAKGFVCLVSLHLALILLSCPHSSDCEFIKSQSEIMKTGPYLVSISECFCTTSLHLEK